MTDLLPTWDDLHSDWETVADDPGDGWVQVLEAARKRLSKNSPADWEWLKDSLARQEKKSFVAAVFRNQSMPKKLLSAFIQAAVDEKNPSFNRHFIEPCLHTYPPSLIGGRLLEYLSSGSDSEVAGAASAFYWVLALRKETGEAEEDFRPIADEFQRIALLTFISNTDLNVRRRIIPMLCLKSGEFTKDLLPQVKEAIKIARSHPDEYIRHRVEVQLGSWGPFFALLT